MGAGPADLVYELRLTTGPDPERFLLGVTGEQFVSNVFEGGAVVPARMTVVGAASVGLFRGMIGDFACSPQSPGLIHGAGTAGWYTWITMPANSSATVTVPARTSGDALWPDMELRGIFTLRNRYFDEVEPMPGTLDEEQTISVAPTYTGPRSPKILLKTDPASGVIGGGLRRPSYHAGTAFRLFGTTSPALPGESVILAYRDAALGRVVEIGRPVVDDQGRFSLEGWVPPAGQYIEVRAFYESTRPDLADDFTCPRAFDIDPAPTSPMPPAPPQSPAPSPILPPALGPSPRVVPTDPGLRLIQSRRGRRLTVVPRAARGATGVVDVTVELKRGARRLRMVKRALRPNRPMRITIPRRANRMVIRGRYRGDERFGRATARRTAKL